jgi:hypothetical protein
MAQPVETKPGSSKGVPASVPVSMRVPLTLPVTVRWNWPFSSLPISVVVAVSAAVRESV